MLKEQYPVTAHAPNFDFWTGCPEIKRCEESKRTLKNPFASRLAEFNTTLKLLRIILQINDILLLLSFDLGQIWSFWRYFYCRWPEDQKMRSALMPSEGLFTGGDNSKKGSLGSPMNNFMSSRKFGRPSLIFRWHSPLLMFYSPKLF